MRIVHPKGQYLLRVKPPEPQFIVGKVRIEIPDARVQAILSHRFQCSTKALIEHTPQHLTEALVLCLDLKGLR